MTKDSPGLRDRVVLGRGDQSRQWRAVRRDDGERLHAPRRRCGTTIPRRIRGDARHSSQDLPGLADTGCARTEQLVKHGIGQFTRRSPSRRTAGRSSHGADLRRVSILRCRHRGNAPARRNRPAMVATSAPSHAGGRKDGPPRNGAGRRVKSCVAVLTRRKRHVEAKPLRPKPSCGEPSGGFHRCGSSRPPPGCRPGPVHRTSFPNRRRAEPRP